MEDNLKSKAAKGLAWNGVSNVAVQLLNMLFGIVLARTLLPEDYGVVGLLALFTGIASALQDGGFGGALVNKKDVSQRDYNAVFWFNVGISSLIYTVFFFSTPFIASFYDVPELKWLGRLVFLGFLFSSLGGIHFVILLKSLKMRESALSCLFATLLSGIIGVILALCGFSYWGLAIQSVSYFLIRTLFLFGFTKWKPSLVFDFSPLKEFWRYGVRVVINNLYLQINSNLMVVLLGKLYDKRDVGFYNQANKWSYMAYSVLTGTVNGISQSLFVAADSSDEIGRDVRVLRKMLRFSAMFSMIGMFGLALVAPEFIHVTISDKWDKSIVLLRYLCIGGAFVPVTNVLTNYVLSKGRSGQMLALNVSQMLLQMGLIVVLYPYGIPTMVAGYAAVNILWFLVWAVVAKLFHSIPLLYLLKDVLPFTCLALVSVFSAYEVSVWIGFQSEILNFIIKGGISVFLYVLFLKLFKVKLLGECWLFIKAKFVSKRK